MGWGPSLNHIIAWFFENPKSNAYNQASAQPFRPKKIILRIAIKPHSLAKRTKPVANTFMVVCWHFSTTHTCSGINHGPLRSVISANLPKKRANKTCNNQVWTCVMAAVDLVQIRIHNYRPTRFPICSLVGSIKFNWNQPCFLHGTDANPTCF